MKKRIREFIATELIDNGNSSELTFENDLLETGLIDSMGIVRLISFIEGEFGLKVPPEDMVVENFQSIEKIEEYLKKSN